MYGLYTPNIIEPIPSLNPNVESRLVSMEDGILFPKYRLPTEAEWEFAALGLIGNTVEELVWERRTCIPPMTEHSRAKSTLGCLPMLAVAT